MTRAEEIAREFHEAYERLAPAHGWDTQKESRVPWAEVPEANRNLMVHVAEELLKRGVIRPGLRLRGSMSFSAGGDS